MSPTSRRRTLASTCVPTTLTSPTPSLTPTQQFKIVITEFALTNPAGGQADQVAFFKKAFDWLDQQDYVELYFPFVASSPSLFSANDAAGAGYVGTGSCLFNDDGTPSAVGNLMY